MIFLCQLQQSWVPVKSDPVTTTISEMYTSLNPRIEDTKWLGIFPYNMSWMGIQIFYKIKILPHYVCLDVISAISWRDWHVRVLPTKKYFHFHSKTNQKLHQYMLMNEHFQLNYRDFGMKITETTQICWDKRKFYEVLKFKSFYKLLNVTMKFSGWKVEILNFEIFYHCWIEKLTFAKSIFKVQHPEYISAPFKFSRARAADSKVSNVDILSK